MGLLKFDRPMNGTCAPKSIAPTRAQNHSLYSKILHWIRIIAGCIILPKLKKPEPQVSHEAHPLTGALASSSVMLLI